MRSKRPRSVKQLRVLDSEALVGLYLVDGGLDYRGDAADEHKLIQV